MKFIRLFEEHNINPTEDYFKDKINWKLLKLVEKILTDYEDFGVKYDILVYVGTPGLTSHSPIYEEEVLYGFKYNIFENYEMDYFYNYKKMYELHGLYYKIHFKDIRQNKIIYNKYIDEIYEKINNILKNLHNKYLYKIEDIYHLYQCIWIH